jgi:hypothetical protein
MSSTVKGYAAEPSPVPTTLTASPVAPAEMPSGESEYAAKSTFWQHARSMASSATLFFFSKGIEHLFADLGQVVLIVECVAPQEEIDETKENSPGKQYNHRAI